MVAVVVRSARGELEVELAPDDSAAVGDVVGALGGVGPEPLYVDGRPVPASLAFTDAEVATGSVLSLTPTSPDRPTTWAEPVAEVQVVGGLDAGLRFPLPPGEHVVGRGDVDVRLSSMTLSLRHLALSVSGDGTCVVRDLGAHNGTRVDGEWVVAPTRLAPGALVQAGAVLLVVTPLGDEARAPVGRPGAGGLVTFDRPPRRARPAPPAPLTPPSADHPGSGTPRFHWSAVVTPLLMGGGMVALTGQLMFAAFMLLSPVMAVTNWVEERRHAKRDRAAGVQRFAAAMKDFTAALDATATGEVLRRRRATPDLAELLRRPHGPSTRLWERRAADGDFAVVGVGTATQRWDVPLVDRGTGLAPEVTAVLATRAQLSGVPLDVALTAGTTIGLVGDRAAGLALARSLVVQAAILAGPADLRVAVLAEPRTVPDWDWCRWLPHTVDGDGSGERLLAGSAGEREALLARLLSAPAGEPRTTHVVVIDADGLTQGRASAARDLLGGAGRAVAGIVIADRAERLPSTTTVVVDLQGPDGLAHHTVPAAGEDVPDVLAWGVSAETARHAARALARYEDSELTDATGSLPERVPLPPLLGDPGDPAAVAATWAAASAARSLVAVLGATERGPLRVDLVADGPHALVAGTTGSGKSELLRSVVAGLAATYPPTELTFVLVDYKGGAAFDECARLPHTVGLVTDLDEELGSRALVCLEAELRHRERVLRDAGATDLAEYADLGRPGGPLPRLVVVIDEFATMAAELPDFIDALVGVAQRGRSLGVHLVLATQRPGGAVKDSIRANTNLRIALRVQDAADSTDVIGTPAAASLSRRVPGRALLRLGPGEVVPFQSALATGTSAYAGSAAPVVVRPLTFGPGTQPGVVAGPTEGHTQGPSDLLRLVDAARAADRLLALPPPRQPWPAPLPETLCLADVEPTGDAVIGLADDPAHQRRGAYVWSPAQGNLLVYGMPGSGTSTVLATVAVSLARANDPRDLHLYAMDFGNQSLAPLTDLPHVAAVLQPAERERQERLVARLRHDVSRRQALRATGGAAALTSLPVVVLLLDGWAAFEAAFDDLPGITVREDLTRVVADGPGVGVHVVATADRAMGVPGSVSTLVAQKLLLRLADRHDYTSFGLRTALHDPPPGRGIDVTSGLVVQVALPGPAGLGEAVTSAAAAYGDGARARGPRPVGVLPDEVKQDDVDQVMTVEEGEWRLPLGLAASTLETATLRVRGGDGVLVTGPTQSGKTSLLSLLCAGAAKHLPGVGVTAVLGRRGSAADFLGARCTAPGAGLDGVADELARARTPQLLLVDDVDDVDDPTGALARLAAARHPHLMIVATGRADVLRNVYDHVAVELRRSRVGVALRPRVDCDGDLWGVSLPRYGPSRFAPGRGYLVADGEAELIQVALP